MPRGLADSLPDVILRYVSWAVCQTLLVGEIVVSYQILIKYAKITNKSLIYHPLTGCRAAYCHRKTPVIEKHTYSRSACRWERGKAYTERDCIFPKMVFSDGCAR